MKNPLLIGLNFSFSIISFHLSKEAILPNKQRIFCPTVPNGASIGLRVVSQFLCGTIFFENFSQLAPVGIRRGFPNIGLSPSVATGRRAGSTTTCGCGPWILGIRHGFPTHIPLEPDWLLKMIIFQMNKNHFFQLFKQLESKLILKEILIRYFTIIQMLKYNRKLLFMLKKTINLYVKQCKTIIMIYSFGWVSVFTQYC